MNEIRDRYFDWLRQQAVGHDRSFDLLLHFLHDRTYIWTLPMDENRAKEGIELRQLFGTELGYREISGLDPERDCSMLEMMVGLARRCENQIMVDMEEGAQPERWFEIMLGNLGLDGMTDDRFDGEEAEDILDRFLSHRYSYYGDGSLFRVRHPRSDMRRTDLWYQAMWFLTENYNEEEE